ncbi:variable surface protein [Plasmodium gonderi]|uniref:Variable surface protein n=1 Tax=Plasmodium gonderi TaxID=77519 RepID=A0A1Y1JQV1_PLAGO|nr:variable surface protein [Plasmodium gonderi]GAW83212.1 variable surface protein [Plasmodium gonderi]
MLYTFYVIWLFTKEDILKELPSYKKYNELNREINEDERNDDCVSFTDEDGSAKELCEKMARNLRELGKMEIGAIRTEKCYYLQHWLYYNTRKILSLEEYIQRKDNVKYKLREVAKNVNNNALNSSPCGCIFDGEFIDWKEEKNLHDYFKNYDYIKCDGSDKGRCQTYIDYVTYINELYKKYYDEYGDYDCCFGLDYCKAYFNCDIEYNPKDLLLKLKETNEKLNASIIPGDKDSRHAEDEPFILSRSQSRPLYMTDEEGLSISKHDTLDKETTPISSFLGIKNNVLKTNNFYRFFFLTSILGTSLFLYFYYRSTLEGFRPNKGGIKRKKFNNYHNDNFVPKFQHHSVEGDLSDSQTTQLYLPY